MPQLTRNFRSEEFSCPCCGLDTIDPDLVDNLQHSRDAVGVPYPINSGCRCEKHNREEGGAKDSAHTPRENGICMAADIGCTDMLTRKKILADVTRRFRHIGIAKTFIHVDDDPEKPDGAYLY